MGLFSSCEAAEVASKQMWLVGLTFSNAYWMKSSLFASPDVSRFFG